MIEKEYFKDVQIGFRTFDKKRKMIQSINNYKEEQHLVIVFDKKSKNDLPIKWQDFADKFGDKEEDFDYIKTENHFVFFVKQNDVAEKNRVMGSKIRTLLPREADAIYIIGDEKTQMEIAEGIALSNYQFISFLKEKAKKEYLLKAICLVGHSNKEGINKLNNSITAVTWARNMVNLPVSHLNALKLSQEIVALGEKTNLNVEVLEKSKIETLKMGGLLAVNNGSIDPPTFTIIEYIPNKPKNKKPLVLVGKGVVYDTGGLSLKPTAGSMDSMKSDMAGAAAVVAAIYNCALNQSDVHVIGLIPATDNRPGLNAYTPGDVITMYNGMTVEVLNTDAEGRMILADALAYSAKYDPALVVDMATLTGAAVVAVGTKASCVMGNDENSLKKLIEAGNDVHERLVEFPFWDEYLEDMKSPIADLKNIGSRYAGMVTAGKFLECFVKAPYVHIDIAGPSFLDAAQEYRPKGGTGVGVRLLTRFIENYF